jgi:hypothetical protein
MLALVRRYFFLLIVLGLNLYLLFINNDGTLQTPLGASRRWATDKVATNNLRAAAAHKLNASLPNREATVHVAAARLTVLDGQRG